MSRPPEPESPGSPVVAPGQPRARIALGNAYWPSSFRLRDHRFASVADGVTPTVVDVPAGLYEVELRGASERSRVLIAVRGDEMWDGRGLALPVDTPVPVHNALRRSQPAAEFVSQLTVRLRSSSAVSGLVIVVLPRPGRRPRASDVGASLEVLAGEALVTGGSFEWVPGPEATSGLVLGLVPGGHLVRTHRGDESTLVPVWVSAGYQTVMFVPWDAGPDLTGLSFHMLPTAWVWTGHDPAASLLEVAVANLRDGHRPFGAVHPVVDFGTLTLADPLVGLLRAQDLVAHPESGVSPVPLIHRLASLLPGHPDVLAFGDVAASPWRRRPTPSEFPPMTAAGQRLVRDWAAAGRQGVGAGSPADLALRSARSVGPWVTWSPPSPVSRPTCLSALRRHVLSRSGGYVADGVGAAMGRPPRRARPRPRLERSSAGCRRRSPSRPCSPWTSTARCSAACGRTSPT